MYSIPWERSWPLLADHNICAAISIKQCYCVFNLYLPRNSDRGHFKPRFFQQSAWNFTSKVLWTIPKGVLYRLTDWFCISSYKTKFKWAKSCRALTFEIAACKFPIWLRPRNRLARVNKDAEIARQLNSLCDINPNMMNLASKDVLHDVICDYFLNRDLSDWIWPGYMWKRWKWTSYTRPTATWWTAMHATWCAPTRARTRYPGGTWRFVITSITIRSIGLSWTCWSAGLHTCAMHVVNEHDVGYNHRCMLPAWIEKLSETKYIIHW